MQTVGVLDAAVSFIRDSRPKTGLTRLIAIDGPSGSGKTQFAAELATKLRASLIPLDEMYRGWDGLIPTIDLLVEFVALPLAHGQDINIPTWDWAKNEPGPLKPIDKRTHIILDGCGSGALAMASSLSALIWLEADETVRRERALKRDGEVFAPHWETWAQQERELWSRDDTRSRADLVFDTSNLQT